MSKPHAGMAQSAEQRFYKPTREPEPLGIFNGYKRFPFVILAGGGCVRSKVTPRHNYKHSKQRRPFGIQWENRLGVIEHSSLFW